MSVLDAHGKPVCMDDRVMVIEAAGGAHSHDYGRHGVVVAGGRGQVCVLLDRTVTGHPIELRWINGSCVSRDDPPPWLRGLH